MPDEKEIIDPGEYLVTVRLRSRITISEPTPASLLIDMVLSDKGADVSDWDID